MKRALFLLLLTGCRRVETPVATKPDDIILITIDTLRADSVGFAGNTRNAEHDRRHDTGGGGRQNDPEHRLPLGQSKSQARFPHRCRHQAYRFFGRTGHGREHEDTKRDGAGQD